MITFTGIDDMLPLLAPLMYMCYGYDIKIVFI